MMIKKVVWFLFFGLLAVSCLDDPDCYNLNSNVIGISFKKIADGKADSIYLYGISIEGTDSIFYGNPSGSIVTDVQLPLNILQDQSPITFLRFGNAGPFTNSLLLGYDTKAQFVSEDCGERFIVSNLHVLSSDFDSTRLVNASPTQNPSTNIIIYRCPIPNVVRFSFRQWNTNEADTLGAALPVLFNSIQDDFSNITYQTSQAVSTIRLPINSESNATTFNMDINSYGNTSIMLNYTSTTQALYIPCGEQKFFSHLTMPAITTTFDKVVVVNDSIQDPPRTNITFFKCPVTNLVRIAFRESTSSTNNISVDILKITADYTDEEFYVEQKASSVELPLNEAAGTTTFTFRLANGDKVLTLNYDTEENVYHEVCNQTEMSSLTIGSSSGFTNAPTVLEPTVTFPTQNNIAVYPNN